MNKYANNILLWVIVAYTLLLAVFLPAYIYQIDSDLIVYITISEQLIAGNFYDALNAYWSPLLSWLMVPFIQSGIDGVIAHKMITCAAGYSILVSLFRLSQQHIQTTLFRILFFVWLLPLLLFFSVSYPTPDILSVAILLMAWNNLQKLIETPSLKYGVLTGILLTLGYLSKYYIFYAGMVFILAAVMYSILIRKKETLKYLLYASIVFIGTSGIWMFCLQYKYHSFAPTTSSAYNMSILNPSGVRHPMQGGDSLLPINYQKYVITSWEYPPDYPLEKWSPTSSFENLKSHLIINVAANFIHLRNKNMVEFLLLLVALVYWVYTRKQYAPVIGLMLACTLLFPIGYFWILTLNRYVIFSLCFAVLISTVVCENAYRKYPIILLVLCMGIGWSHKSTFKVLLHPHYTGTEYLRYYEQALSKTDLTHSKIIASPMFWKEGLCLSYYSKSKFYDTLKPDNLGKALPKLQQEGIRYYLCSETEVPTDFSSAVVYANKCALIDLSLYTLPVKPQ